MIAASRHHHNALAVFVLNLFAGWTFVLWIWALVWACMATERRPEPVLDIGAELRARGIRGEAMFPRAKS
jgi:hypothetical protein